MIHLFIAKEWSPLPYKVEPVNNTAYLAVSHVKIDIFQPTKTMNRELTVTKHSPSSALQRQLLPLMHYDRPHHTRKQAHTLEHLALFHHFSTAHTYVYIYNMYTNEEAHLRSLTPFARNTISTPKTGKKKANKESRK